MKALDCPSLKLQLPPVRPDPRVSVTAECLPGKEYRPCPDCPSPRRPPRREAAPVEQTEDNPLGKETATATW